MHSHPTKYVLVAPSPSGSHEPVIYPIAVVRDAKEPAMASEFIAFLSSESSTRVFRKYGFLPGVDPLTGSSQSTVAALDLSPLWISLKTSAAATALTFILGLLVAHACLCEYQPL